MHMMFSLTRIIVTNCVAVVSAQGVAKTSGTGIFVADEGAHFLADPAAVLADTDYDEFISATRRMLQSGLSAADEYRYNKMNVSAESINATNLTCSANSKTAQAAWESLKML